MGVQTPIVSVKTIIFHFHHIAIVQSKNYIIPMENITLRIATPADAAALLEIYKPYVENTAITYEWDVPSLEEFAGRIESTLRKFPYIVAEKDGQPVGYAYASPFKTRAAYQWAIETSIYVAMGNHKMGIGKLLLLKLEELLAEQGVLNVNACIAYPEVEDEYLTKNSVQFHEKMGYRLVGEFHKCGYKFNRWYNMVWMEKMIGNHIENQPEVKTFNGTI